MERMAADAAYSRLHEDRPWHDGSFERWAEKPSREFPYHVTFGVTVGVAESDLRPWDNFLKRESASPVEPVQSEDLAPHEDDGQHRQDEHPDALSRSLADDHTADDKPDDRQQ